MYSTAVRRAVRGGGVTSQTSLFSTTSSLSSKRAQYLAALVEENGPGQLMASVSKAG